MFLSGVTVVDWSTGYTGPFAARILGDLGATVIRVDDPGVPDPLRTAPPLAGGQSALHAYLNAGKTIVRLDPLARRAAKRLRPTGADGGDRRSPGRAPARGRGAAAEGG